MIMHSVCSPQSAATSQGVVGVTNLLICKV